MTGLKRPPAAGRQTTAWRERVGVLALAGAIVTVMVVYLVLGPGRGGDAGARTLLPYQVLASTLPAADQQTFGAIREGLPTAEGERARDSRWPTVEMLAAAKVAPFAAVAGGPVYRWSMLEFDGIVNYIGLPDDPSHPAWLLEIQEPIPGLPQDPAPLSDQHHLLADGTKLHIYVWKHGYGGQVKPAPVRQPQMSGWIEVFRTPPDPAYYTRR